MAKRPGARRHCGPASGTARGGLHSIRPALRSLVLVLALLGSGCGSARRTNAEMMALAARNRQPYSEADVRFMTRMIPHHAQAVLFAGWAESHGASEAVQVFCARMVVAQRDEIQTMRSWLLERGEPAPPGEYARGQSHGPGHELMQGMLTDTQLDELDGARGADFDRLFLTNMIPHHEGALAMVGELFDTPGGAQNDFVFKLASDIHADQEIEIERMQSILAALPPGARP